MKRLLVLLLAFFTVYANAVLLRMSPAQAAAQTAQGRSCARVGPFYWEVGNSGATLASGAVGAGFDATTPIGIASASKWLYGAYAAQKGFAEAERPYLNLTSGYVSFGLCTARQTVLGCATAGTNGQVTSSEVGRFDYGGGHMQHHAALGSLATMDAGALGKEVSAVLGVTVTYSTPQLAGGANISPSEYAKFARRLMTGALKLGPRLGESPVCTLPGTCKTADNSPAKGRNWDYSIGHWVERDIDGAFSSAGAFGFYPWISADKKLYGVVATKRSGAALLSAACGAAIRQAYTTGRPQ